MDDYDFMDDYDTGESLSLVSSVVSYVFSMWFVFGFVAWAYFAYTKVRFFHFEMQFPTPKRMSLNSAFSNRRATRLGSLACVIPMLSEVQTSAQALQLLDGSSASDLDQNIQEEEEETSKSDISIISVSHGPPHPFDEPIKAEDLPHVYRKKLENFGQQFGLEFWLLGEKSSKIQNSSAASSTRSNAKKNRYSNVFPYDNSRVTLSGRNNYINSSLIEGYKKRKRFIATQGPIRNTVGDFWRMVWEYNVDTIVMLCNVMEEGREKCVPYWTAGTRDNIAVSEDTVLNLGGILLRKISLKQLKLKETREVAILQYTAWPDHGVPKTTTLVMYLHRMVEERTKEDIPVVVHCSAGAGRSGTYIAMDILFDQLKEEKQINVSKVVYELRLCRSEMIQRQEQYQFVYTLLLERHLFPESDFFVSDFLELDRTEKSWISIVSKEFQYLRRFGLVPFTDDGHAGSPPHGPTMAPQATELETPYMPLPVIISPLPNDSGKLTFWRMVLENNIVCLITLDETPTSTEFSGEKAVIQVEDLTIKILRTDKQTGYNLRYLKVINANKISVSLVHLYVTCWKDVSKFPDKQFFDDTIHNMKDAIYKSHHRKLLIACEDGNKKPGIFVAFIEMIERLKVNKRIDVFRTIKDLKAERPLVVDTLDVYKNIYQFMFDYAVAAFPDFVRGNAEEFGVDYKNIDPEILGLQAPEGINAETTTAK